MASYHRVLKEDIPKHIVIIYSGMFKGTDNMSGTK